MSSRSGGTRRADAKTPEHAHAEKVARAEENVRKAQARYDTAYDGLKAAVDRARPDYSVAGSSASREFDNADRALRSAQTRLANLKAQGPGGTRTDARSRTYERQIAQHEAQVAQHASEAARLRAEYEEYRRTGNAPTAKAGGRSQREQKTPRAFQVHLVPIKQVKGFRIDPAAPADPYLIREAFGEGQLRTALSLFSATKLRPAADRVMERNPGTRPHGRSKDALIDYIVQHVGNG